MSDSRSRHRDVLIAGLMVVGAVMWVATTAFQLVEPDRLTRGATWFAGTFLAAHLARRALVLDVGQTVIAAIVMSAIVMGIFVERRGETIHVDALIPIGLAGVGSIAGALTTRRRSDHIHIAWRLLAGGLGALGAAMVAGGVAMLFLDKSGIGLVVLGGATVGSCLTAAVLDLVGWHSAVGLALPLATTMLDSDNAADPVIGLAVGAILGGIGGAIGCRIRGRRTPKSELPDARVR